MRLNHIALFTWWHLSPQTRHWRTLDDQISLFDESYRLRPRRHFTPSAVTIIKACTDVSYYNSIYGVLACNYGTSLQFQFGHNFNAVSRHFSEIPTYTHASFQSSTNPGVLYAFHSRSFVISSPSPPFLGLHASRTPRVADPFSTASIIVFLLAITPRLEQLTSLPVTRPRRGARVRACQ